MSSRKEGTAVHRPGPLKQSNKAHKHERGKSSSRNKGKVDVKTITHSKRHDLNKQERKHRTGQLHKSRRDEVLSMKRSFGGSNSPPILVAIIPLDYCVDPIQFLEELKTCDDEITTSYNKRGDCHLSSSRLKQRFSFIIPKFDDMHAIMDAAKIVDTIVFLHASADVQDDYTEMLLSTVLAHALPTSFHVIQELEKLNPKKKSQLKKSILKTMESRFPGHRLHNADTKSELQLILRQIGAHKQRFVNFRDCRSHLLAENVEFVPDQDSESRTGTLKVSGYIRGQPLNVNALVYIPGWENFQMSQIAHISDPHPLRKNKNGIKDEDMVSDDTILIQHADPLQRESLQSEIIPDPMEGEQTWPTEDDFADAMDESLKKKSKRVPEGTSEYQASWIINSDGEEISDGSDSEEDSAAESMGTVEEECSDEDMDSEKEDETTKNIENTNNYDKDLNMVEERKMLVRFREERTEKMFPDEKDTPTDITAEQRYKRYRGLKSFSNSAWDPLENLPPDYGRIYRFENFRQTKKKIMTAAREGALPGLYVTLHIVHVPESLYDELRPNHPLIVYGLLPHEQKMSVVNVAIKKHFSCKKSIMSKDSLIFHIGVRRFTCKPIFSTHSVGDKFKYEKFLPEDNSVVASFYAPVIFPPTPVVIFRQQPNGCHELVATGSVLNVNPNRMIIKRIVLSGHPFKIFIRSAVVRYMFFNPEDINYFKCIELRTKLGRKGHIKEALGSHGHMKCVFDRQLKSEDVVLMSLYKRVFPKWSYDPYVPTPVSQTENCMM